MMRQLKAIGITILICAVVGTSTLAACAPSSESPASSSEERRVVVEEPSEPMEAPAEPKVEDAEPVQSAEMAAAEQATIGLVEGYGDAVAVTVEPLDGSLGFSINGDRRFVSASMIKLLVLAEFLSEVDAGKISYAGTYTRNSADVVGGSGQIQVEAAGTVYTYDDLARYMIKYSDNTATNVLIDILGVDAINGRASELGLKATDLERKLMIVDPNLQNHICADDAAEMLRGFANHTIASDESCARAEGYLREQEDSEGLAEGLPAGVAFGHKTGTLDTLRHDGGIVYAERPYVIVMLCDIGIPEANDLMTRVSGAVFESLQ